MDDSIRDFVDRLDYGFHGFPRRRWINPPFTLIRGHFLDSALRAGSKDRVKPADQSIRLFFAHPLSRVFLMRGKGCFLGTDSAGTLLPPLPSFKTS